MAAKRKRSAERAPGALPSTLSLPRVLRAVAALGHSEAEFRAAYQEAAAPRGRGVSQPSAKVLAAFNVFQQDGDFEAFVSGAGFKDRTKATNELGRCARYLAQQERRQR